tara:strand:+ start:1528 stop:1905 length:378 start_codon:yes stop_codon:yes gene_type:complete
MDVLSGDDCFRKLDEPYYILFYFTASWCGPCQRIYPHLVELMNTYDKNIIQCFKIDIDDDENQELCEKLKIKSVPTFILLKDRNYIDQCQGASIENIQTLIDTNIFINNQQEIISKEYTDNNENN